MFFFKHTSNKFHSDSFFTILRLCFPGCRKFTSITVSLWLPSL